MEKIKVYSSYMSASLIVISVLCFALGVAACVLFPVVYVTERFIIPIILSIVAFPLLWYSGYLKQVLLITSETLTLKNLYRTMVTLKKEDIIRIEINELPTYFSWAKTINKKYICIYSSKNNVDFLRGSSNKSGLDKIQLFYKKEKFEKILQTLKIEL